MTESASQRNACRRHRPRARLCGGRRLRGRARPPRRLQAPRASCCPPACPSCAAISRRRWRPPSSAWASPRASTTTRCRARGRCCSPRASRMPGCRPCWATATATSSAAWRTNGPRARVRGSPRATAIASTAAAPPTTRASTPSTWRRWTACAQERGGTPRLQRQVHHRDGRGGGLQGPGRAGRRPQGGLRRRRPDRLGRPAREA